MDRRAILLALMLAFCVTPASAQRAFKYVYPDGRIVYSDKPVPGARMESEVAAPPPPSGGEAATPQPPPPARGQADDAIALRSRKLAEAQRDLVDGERELVDAKARLEAGREPLEGERIGTYGGRAKLNDAYWARQWQNEQAVADAQAKIDRARQQLIELR